MRKRKKGYGIREKVVVHDLICIIHLYTEPCLAIYIKRSCNSKGVRCFPSSVFVHAITSSGYDPINPPTFDAPFTGRNVHTYKTNNFHHSRSKIRHKESFCDEFWFAKQSVTFVAQWQTWILHHRSDFIHDEKTFVIHPFPPCDKMKIFTIFITNCQALSMWYRPRRQLIWLCHVHVRGDMDRTM